MPDSTTSIELDDLAVTWRTLTRVFGNYHMGSPGEATLIEARRLVEVEIRALHGDEAWASVTNADQEGPTDA